jgi:proline iminopeptidase
MEYALKYQQNLKGLIISNMMASGPAYNEYAIKVLMPAMDQKALAEIKQIEAKKDYQNSRYMELPDPVNRVYKHLNPDVYIPMQGPSELGLSGKLLTWDRTNDLSKIAVPTLVIGARYDTMDPAHMEMMSKKVQKGRYLFCPNGSHMAMYDDQKVYVSGLIEFILDVGSGRF